LRHTVRAIHFIFTERIYFDSLIVTAAIVNKTVGATALHCTSPKSNMPPKKFFAAISIIFFISIDRYICAKERVEIHV
jgi:hypothetical protein